VKNFYKLIIIFFMIGIMHNSNAQTSNFISADNPNIQYFGRWDFSNKGEAKFSWPGVYICAEFTGTSIGIRLNDAVSYYNVFIDDELYKIFHGNIKGQADYLLVENLDDKLHSIRISKRNISFDSCFTFYGFILDDGADLMKPKLKPSLKIEFIGDSFTAAESNEAVEQELEWEKRFPVTNIDKGFAPLIAKHFNAQYTTTCRSGSGMVCDWQGNTSFTIPKFFDRTLMELELPKWNFNRWIPEIVVICLGINDYSGLKNVDDSVSNEKTDLYIKGYHEFIKTLREKYPLVKIVAVASFNEWMKKNVAAVVNEEIKNGNQDIFYTQFDFFEGGYVAYGHPTVETHNKMANQIIEAIESASGR